MKQTKIFTTKKIVYLMLKSSLDFACCNVMLAENLEKTAYREDRGLTSILGVLNYVCDLNLFE
jgi:hypothetical protein